MADHENNDDLKIENENEVPFWANIFKRKEQAHYDILRILRKIPLFATLTPKEVKRVALAVYERKYQAGEFLFKEGNPGTGMFIIKEGAISIERVSENGDIMHLASLKSGDFVGELSLLSDDPRSASARCTKTTTVIVLVREDLFDFIDRDLAVGVKILKELAKMIGERLKDTNKALLSTRMQCDQYKKKQEDVSKKFNNLVSRVKKPEQK